MRRPVAILAVTVLPAVLLPMGGAAAETSKSFVVSAQIANGCIVSTDGAAGLGRIDFGTASGVAQGTIDASLALGGSAGISIECTPGLTVNLTANAGAHADNGNRRMGPATGGATPIPYQLFVDGSSTPWGAQAIPVPFQVGTGPRTLPIRGSATLTRPMAAGSYSDTVQVTLTW